MVKSKTTYVAALDIGSSKIICVIAELTLDGKLTVIGIGHNESQGIKSGVITHIQKAEDSIRQAVSSAEQMAEINVEKVIVNISGAKQESHHIKVQVPINHGQEITERDIQRLIEEGCKQYRSNDRTILHCIPMDYGIDGNHGITDPKGMFGTTLEAQLHFVTSCSTAILNLTNCLAHCELDISYYVSSPYASGYACLTDDEKQLGCLLIEFGGSNTTISSFKHGHITYLDTIALGGAHITYDLAYGTATSLEYAERTKTLNGSLFQTTRDYKTFFDVPQIGEHGITELSHISRGQIADIIRPRAEEIVEMIKHSLETHPFTKSGKNLVITGGAAQLSGLKEYIAQYLDKQVRIGVPGTIDGLFENAKNPIFCTAIGMLKYNVDKLYSESYDYSQSHIGMQGKFVNIMKWFKDNF